MIARFDLVYFLSLDILYLLFDSFKSFLVVFLHIIFQSVVVVLVFPKYDANLADVSFIIVAKELQVFFMNLANVFFLDLQKSLYVSIHRKVRDILIFVNLFISPDYLPDK